MQGLPRSGGQTHPGPRQYVMVAVILSVITLIEVGAYYLTIPRAFFFAILMVLSTIKFGLVVLFYMHLKFDDRLYSTLFIGGMVLAVSIMVALLALFVALFR
jgi:cytochrome c oxidase subunit 4